MLSINDKDYSITFGLYFSVEWVEPRLNLSSDVWGYSGDSLVPGEWSQGELDGGGETGLNLIKAKS